jgi:hypothetical protein
MEGIDILFHWTIEAFPHMYNSTMKAIQEQNLTSIDVAVTDMGTRVGPDSCDTLNIACIINNLDILDALRWFILPPADYSQVNFPNSKIIQWGKGTWQRALLPVLRSFLTFKVWCEIDPRLNALRKSVGLLKPIGDRNKKSIRTETKHTREHGPKRSS